MIKFAGQAIVDNIFNSRAQYPPIATTGSKIGTLTGTRPLSSGLISSFVPFPATHAKTLIPFLKSVALHTIAILPLHKLISPRLFGDAQWPDSLKPNNWPGSLLLC
jgi:hypothetical protein